MNEIIVSVTVFHTLSSIALLAGCAVTSVFRDAPRRTMARDWVDQMEVDADAILSATPAAHPAPSHAAPARESATAAA